MLQALIPLISTVIDKILPDPKIASEAKLRLFELTQNGELAKLTAETDLAKGQIDVNKIEAASQGVFKGGWRPAVGWTCAGGLFYQLILRPLLGWMASNWLGWTMPPSLELETLMTLLFGMLGMGAYRMKEKLAGAA